MSAPARVDFATIAHDLLGEAASTVSANFEIETGEKKSDVLAAAQVYATLAVVEQQRIANVIALGQFRVGVEDLPHLRHLVIEPKGEHDIQPTASMREALGL